MTRSEWETAFRQRVQEGIRLLTSTMPDWRSRIDILTFSFRCTGNCIIGQLFPDSRFSEGLRALGIDYGWKYGFDLNEVELVGDFEWCWERGNEIWLVALAG